MTFTETRIPLYTDEWYVRLPDLPAGRVPVLRHGTLNVWDSAAIITYVREQLDGTVGWPGDLAARATAWSIAAEMQAGFAEIRTRMPFNCRASGRRADWTELLQREVGRVCRIWRESRERFGVGGPWLFGSFTVADVMYAPVASRFVTYGVDLDPVCRAYVDAIHAIPAIKEWIEAAASEPEVLESYEVGR